MFVLKNRNDSKIIYLERGKKYLFGRHNSNDIALPADNTISKKHARISVTPVNHVTVMDCNSTNKTFIDGKVLEPNIEVDMNAGSEIKFGVKDSTFILQKEADIIVTSSGLSSTCRKSLHDTINKLSGQLLIDWSEACSHIVVEHLVLTVKILSALVSNQPIVTPHFFDKYLTCIQRNKPLPLEKQFAPEIIGLSVNMKIDLYVDRKLLFANKIFVFPDKPSYKQMRKIITMAGGTAMVCDKNQVSKKLLLASPINVYVFIQTLENSQNDNSYFNQCVHYLIKNQRRSIPIQEIATAVVTNDCTQNCNPSFDKTNFIFGANPNPADHGLVLVTESQSQLEVAIEPVIATPLIIPATFENDGLEVIENDEAEAHIIEIDGDSFKRNGDELENSVSKKIKVDKSLLKENESSSQNQTNIITSTQIMDHTPVKRKVEDLESSRKTKNPKTMPKENPFSFKPTSTQPKGMVLNPFALMAIQKSKVKDTKEEMSAPLNEKKKYSQMRAFLSSSIEESNKKIVEKSCEVKKSNEVKKSKEVLENATLINEKKYSQTPSFLSSTLIDKSDQIITSSTDTNNKQLINVLENNTILSASSIKSNNTTNVTKMINTSKWLSKDDVDLCKIIKSLKIEDDDTKAYEAQFKTIITVVSADSLIVRKALQDISQNSISSVGQMNNTSGVNYKKFVKVKPLHVQKTIFPRSNYKNVICTTRRAGDNESSDSDSEADEVIQKQSPVLPPSITNPKRIKNDKKYKFDL